MSGPLRTAPSARAGRERVQDPRNRHRPRGRWRHEGLRLRCPPATDVRCPAYLEASRGARTAQSKPGSGFWAVAFAFLIVMAVTTLPSPLYGLYRTRDNLSALTITVVFAIFAGGTIGTLQRDNSLTARIGRRGMMLGAVAMMMVAMGVLAAWKDLPGLLIGRLLTGVAVRAAPQATAITYLVELRLRADPNASAVRARTIGTSVNVGALGVGPLIAGCLAQWARWPLTLPYLVFIALGAVALSKACGPRPETGKMASTLAPEKVESHRRFATPGPASSASGSRDPYALDFSRKWPVRRAVRTLPGHHVACRPSLAPGGRLALPVVFLQSSVPTVGAQATGVSACSRSGRSPCS